MVWPPHTPTDKALSGNLSLLKLIKRKAADLNKLNRGSTTLLLYLYTMIRTLAPSTLSLPRAKCWRRRTDRKMVGYSRTDGWAGDVL